MRACTVNVCIFWQKSAHHGLGEVSISGKSSDEGFTPCNISSSKINISLPYYISAGLKQNIQNKSIPLSSMINGNLKEHDKVMLGANTNTSGQMKGPWNYIYTSNISPASASYASEDNGDTKLSGFSWPPRLYVCSFCKREFRSAQALGGHMNVHRRDRARLRQSPPASPSSPPELVTGICPPMTTVGDSINLNLIPNPNPNLVYSSAWVIQKPNSIDANCITHSSTIPSPKPPTSDPLTISSSSGAPISGTRRWSVTTRLNPFASSTSTRTPNLIYGKYKNYHNIPEGNNNKAIKKGESTRLGFSTGVLRKEEVDLELRLGYSS